MLWQLQPPCAIGADFGCSARRADYAWAIGVGLGCKKNNLQRDWAVGVGFAVLAADLAGSRRARRSGRLGGKVRMAATATAAASGDGLLLIEHLNLNVERSEVALAFYAALGAARDERRPLTKTPHLNLGALTQFHTPSPENEAGLKGGAQRWRGEVQLLYRDEAALLAAQRRLELLKGEPGFEDSQLQVGAFDGALMTVTCPYGNIFSLRVATAQQLAALSPQQGVRPGSEASTCLGMGGVVLKVPPGTAQRGACFYTEVFGCGSRELRPGSWAVLGGPDGQQQLILEEAADASGRELGEHIAIYVKDYAGCFERLLEKGLIWVNPRFVHLDKSTTLEEAWKYSTFRFKDIVELDSGEKLFELEHEVRTVMHKSCPPCLKDMPAA